jgi:hypothetical protein
MKLTQLRTSFLTVAGIAACLPALSALTIGPGQSAGPDVFTTAANSAGYTLLDSTGIQNVTPFAGRSFDATYDEFVYRDTNNIFCSTCLDFLLVVSNAGPGVIDRIATGDFGSFYLTDAGYNTMGITGGPSAVGGGIIPATADRSASGDVVGFNFNSTGVITGQSTVLLEIETNATSYTAGTVSIIDSFAGFGPGFVPASAAPEPVSLSLLGAGLLAIGFLRKRSGSKS